MERDLFASLSDGCANHNSASLRVLLLSPPRAAVVEQLRGRGPNRLFVAQRRTQLRYRKHIYFRRIRSASDKQPADFLIGHEWNIVHPCYARVTAPGHRSGTAMSKVGLCKSVRGGCCPHGNQNRKI